MRDCKYYYGIDFYDIHCMYYQRRIMEERRIDFRQVCLMLDHKLALRCKVEYIIEKRNYSHILLDKCDDLIRYITNIRNSILKYNMRLKNNEKVISQIRSDLNYAKEFEVNLLEEI